MSQKTPTWVTSILDPLKCMHRTRSASSKVRSGEFARQQPEPSLESLGVDASTIGSETLAYIKKHNLTQGLIDAVARAAKNVHEEHSDAKVAIAHELLETSGPPVLNDDPCVLEPPPHASLLDNTVLFLPAVAVTQLQLEPNINDDHGPKTMWTGRYWQLRNILNKQSRLSRRVEMSVDEKARVHDLVTASPAALSSLLLVQKIWRAWFFRHHGRLAVLDHLEGLDVRGVMVYMHGSGGLTWHNARYARAAAGFSYVVVCPDEMAGSRFRSRATRALLTSRDATGYWENSLFYSGAKSAEGESLEFNTKVDEVLDDKEHFKTLYQKVYFVRRAELHFTLSRLPRFASHVGVVIMGTSEGAMTVSRFDDQRYGSMIVGRIIASYAAEFCYMHSRPEDGLLGGQKDVPTLNLIGSHDEFFGPPAHGTFSGSAASIIAGAAVKQGWGKVNITGNAYRSMAEQGVLSGLTVTFPGAKHDITLSHNHAVRDIFLDFLQQPHRCASVLARWETHPFLGAHAILVRKCAPAGTDDAATDEGVPGQRVTWIDMRANPKYPPTLPHRVAIRSRATEKEIPEESLADENEMLKALGEQAHALTAHSVVHVGAKAALAAMHKHSSKLDLHKAHGEEDPYAAVYELKVAAVKKSMAEGQGAGDGPRESDA